jgi:hypothetical protein
MKKMEHVNESGEVMLEGLIVYTITVFLLFFLLAIFSVLFQAWNVQTIANETAAKAAATYKLADSDLADPYVSVEQITGISRFRYWFGDDSLEREAETKSFEYSQDRLQKTTYTKAVTQPEVVVQVKEDTLARRHIEVTITGEYTVPFGEALSYFGFDSIAHYETTASAECLDLIDYIDTVDFAGKQCSLDILGSSLVGAINKMMKLIHDITD